MINRDRGDGHRRILAYFLYLIVETGVTLRGRTHRASVPSKCECANSALRVMGDSLSGKFDSRPIISEREEERVGEGWRRPTRDSMTGEPCSQRVVAEI